MEKVDKYFTLYHIPFTVKEFQYTFFTLPNKESMASLIKKHEWISFSKDSTSKWVFLTTSKYSQETPVLEYLFNKFAGQKACHFIKKCSNIGVSCEIFTKRLRWLLLQFPNKWLYIQFWFFFTQPNNTESSSKLLKQPPVKKLL